jgi:hypothetical protein
MSDATHLLTPEGGHFLGPEGGHFLGPEGGHFLGPEGGHPDPSIAAAGARIAELLNGTAIAGLRDPSGSDLVFEERIEVRPLVRGTVPADVWAVDGGQALVADARCLQVYAARAARVHWRDGSSVLEDEGTLQAFLFGLGEERRSLAGLGAPVSPDSPVDVNLVRDWKEWSAVARCVEDADPGGMVLVDGDLQPDWRIPSSWLAALLERAGERRVVVAGVTKHTSLSWNGAPLLAQLERMASEAFGERGCWWVPVARTRPDVGEGIQVVVARMDPDARFSFRIDLPAGCDAEAVLGSLSALCDDAAFPGYPYPLSVADRLAACGSFVRDEMWTQIAEELDRAGVPLDVRERAFADRHRLMERA